MSGAEVTPVDPHECKYRTALEAIDVMDPEDFKTGQDHLTPAFREPNLLAAMEHIIDIVNRTLHPEEFSEH